MLNLIMNNKGFNADNSLNETLNFEVAGDKPLNPNVNKDIKVDINVLKARAQEVQDRANKKSILIFIFLLLILAVFGVYLSS